MARITEELMLLLLDNAAAEPALESARRRRILAAGVLLDLAYGCQIRPSLPSDAVAPGRLLVLMNTAAVDPVCATALRVLRRRPLGPASAIAKVGRTVQDDLLAQLERAGEVRPTPVIGTGGKPRRAWLITDRTRVSGIRAALVGALFDGDRAEAATAAVITVLHTAHALGAVLSLDRRGWEWVEGQAADIVRGSWVDDDAGIAEVNLAVTAAAVRTALT